MYKKGSIVLRVYHLYTVYILIIIGVCASCSEDFNVFSDTPSVPVVYCILDVQDTVYKVLVTKTFSGNQSAEDMAKDPEMISLKNAKVTLEAWKLGYPVWSTSLKPVSYPRDTGFFSSTAQCAFETRNVMADYFGLRLFDEGKDSLFETLRLVVDYGDYSKPTYARIDAHMGKPDITYPVKSFKTLSLCDTVPYYIQFYGSSRYYYDLRCNLTYSELSDARTIKTLDFSIRQNIQVQTGLFTYVVDQDRFFMRLAQSFDDTPDVVRRDVISVDLRLCIGSQPLKTFMQTYNSDNENGYQLWNCFTNGIGLFALKTYSVLPNLKMDQHTLDSLSLGRYTKQLKFNRW
jgi:hypothetical protein